MKRKLTAILLAVCLLAAAFPTLAVPAADVKGHWAESYIETLRSLGIMEGYPDGTFRPNSNVTKAELATLLNRTFGLTEKKEISYADVAAGKWYYDQFRLAADYVFTFSGGHAYPDTALTRQEAASMFGRLMSFTDVGDVAAFTDDAGISSWAKTYIYAGAVKNLITGYPEGTFRPLSNITRAEVATVLNRLIGTVIGAPGTYTEADVDSNITVRASGVTLKDIHIHGDLYLTGQIGDGMVTLENCQIDGEIIAVGNPGCTLILAGETNNAEIRGDGVKLAVTGTVRELTVKSADQRRASLNITSGAAVEKLTMMTPGDVSGKVGTAFLYMSGVSFSLSPDYWNLNSGASVTIEGREYRVSGARGPAFTEGYPKASVKLTSGGSRQTFAVSVNLQEPATIYCIAVPRGSAAPTPEQVKARVGYGAVTVADSNSTDYSAIGITRTVEMNNLPSGQAFDIYIVAESVEETPKLGAVIELQVSAAVYDAGYPMIVGLSADSVTAAVKTVRTATIYMTAVPKGQAAPSGQQLQTGSYGIAAASVTTAADSLQQLTVTGLKNGPAAYDLYIAAADPGGEPSADNVVKFELSDLETTLTVTASEEAVNGAYPLNTALTVRFSGTPYTSDTRQALGTAGAMPADVIRLTAQTADGQAAEAAGYAMAFNAGRLTVVPPLNGWTPGWTYTLHFDRLMDENARPMMPQTYSFKTAGAASSAVRTPQVTPAAGTPVQPGSTITLSLAPEDAQAGAVLVYTIDGSDPRTSPTAQTEAGRSSLSWMIPDTAKSGDKCRIRAYSYLGGMYSAEIDAIFTIQDVLQMPIVTVRDTGASLPSGSEVASGTVILLAAIDENAAVFYTTDGTAPAAAGIGQKEQQITVSGPIGSTFTLKAILTKGDYRSEIYTFTYTISETTKSTAASTPVITKGEAGAVLADGMAYEVEKDDRIYIYNYNDYLNTQLYYTLDGSDPADGMNLTRHPFSPSRAGEPLVLRADNLVTGVQTRLRVVVFNFSTGDYSEERDLTLYRTK